MDIPLLYFVVGFIASMVGTIPFGPINLTVLKATIDHGPRRGVEIALAASLVEFGQVFLALWFGKLITTFLQQNAVVGLLFALLFIVLAIVVVKREAHPLLPDNADSQQSFFRRGLFIAVLNPQVIPAWIVTLAVIDQYVDFNYVGIYQLLFLIGVSGGKFAALYGFVMASDYLASHLQQSGRLVNRLLAVILLLIGLSQGYTAVATLVA
jgi:threonine/homoserine/homoserine lactone efflux protein